MPAHRANRPSPAGPVLVALLVGAIVACGVWVNMAEPAWTSSHGDPDGRQAAHMERGTVLDAGKATSTPPPPPPAANAPALPPPPPAPPPTTATLTQQQRVVRYVNQARADAGCARPLVVDQRLVNAAQAHSSDMATRNYFSHVTPEGDTFADRTRAAGYPSPGGENIAKGQRSAEQVMEDWLASEGHRRNILNCEFRAIGVGLDTDGWYWTQLFGR